MSKVFSANAMTQLYGEMHDAGFDATKVTEDGYLRIRCSQCAAMMIQGVACHERGCPNHKRHTESEDD